jgi:topoisomerase-4 subunit A
LRERGAALKSLFKDAADGEAPVAVYAATPAEDGTMADAPAELVWLTRLGMIKRSAWGDACGVQKSIFQCYKLREDKSDEVVRVDEFVAAGNTIMLISGAGFILNAQTGDVPLQGRIAGGVKGMAIAEDDVTVCASVAKPSGFVVAVTNKGHIKRVETKKIDKMVRYRKGLQFGGALEKGEKVVFGSWVRGDEDLVLQTEDGKILSVPVAEIALTDRVGKWKALTKVGKAAVVAGYIHRRKKNN